MRSLSAFMAYVFLCWVTGCGHCQTSTATASQQSLPSAGSGALGDGRKSSGPPAYDDLDWLVGRWWCVEKSWLAETNRIGGGHSERVLEWFNVYYPFADENLTLQLTGNPEDRCIAAEFVIRTDPNDYYAKKGLSSMSPRSVVCISTNVIAVGDRFNRFELKYRLVNGSKRPRLEMESKHMRLVFEKVCDVPGDIRESGTVAPIKTYSPEKIAALERQYRELKKQPR